MSKQLSKISKKSKIIAAVAFVLGITALGAGLTYADTTTRTTGDPMSALVTAISQKFNLNAADVQTVVDQAMTEQRAQMEAAEKAKFSARIAQAVTARTLTQAQADSIIAKQIDEEVFRESLKDTTKTERDTLMKSHMASLQQWATDNNISAEYAFFGGGFGRGHDGPHPDFEVPDGEN